jgi:RNA polymerase sigma-70 factor, ECF subfamily
MQTNVTLLLGQLRQGDRAATGRLLELVYGELRGIAGQMFRDEAKDHTLQPTALVNELCVRLLGSDMPEWQDRQHFFRAAARAMHNLLVDHARAKATLRRGGGEVIVSLEIGSAPAAAKEVDLVLLEDTLRALMEHDPRLGEVFDLRLLAGLSVKQTAEMLGCSERTVEVDTQFIRAWLRRELK